MVVGRPVRGWIWPDRTLHQSQRHLERRRMRWLMSGQSRGYPVVSSGTVPSPALLGLVGRMPWVESDDHPALSANPGPTERRGQP